MQQLSGLDTAFVHQDSYRTPMHICAVLLYDTGEDDQWATSLDILQRLAAERLGQFPLFRRKLRRVALDMDTPYWVDIAEPHWDRHLSESTLPEGGDWDMLMQQLGYLHSTRMDLADPLWEMHLIHGVYDIPGLPRNCQALVLKVHHSAVDLHQAPDDASPERNKAMQAPAQWELWTRAHLNSVSRQLKLAETVSNLLPGFLRARETRQQFSDLPPIHSTECRFNARVRAGRSTGAILLPMADVIAVKRAVGRVTLNDIAIACVAGALREYLLFHRKLPGRSLAAGIPINLRAPDDERAGGNKIATMVVGLATHVANPVERLRLVHRYAVAGKKQINALGSGTVMDISDSLTPGVLAEGMKTIARARRVVAMPVPFHTMISNVPGPQTTLFLGDARLVVPIGLGPVRDNMGLFHIVSTSESMMSLSFSACTRLLPDGGFYQQCLHNAFTALLAEAGSDTSKS